MEHDKTISEKTPVNNLLEWTKRISRGDQLETLFRHSKIDSFVNRYDTVNFENIDTDIIQKRNSTFIFTKDISFRIWWHELKLMPSNPEWETSKEIPLQT